MELRDALAQITEIRTQIARNETFRGYRAATVGLSGLLALAGAAAQARWLPEPAQHLTAYLALWFGLAAVSLAVVSAEMAARSYWYASPLARQLTLLAVEQFVPSLVAGGLLTAAVVLTAREAAWLLPGLWAVVFSLARAGLVSVAAGHDVSDRRLLPGGRHRRLGAGPRRGGVFALGHGGQLRRRPVARRGHSLFHLGTKR